MNDDVDLVGDKREDLTVPARDCRTNLDPDVSLSVPAVVNL